MAAKAPDILDMSADMGRYWNRDQESFSITEVEVDNSVPDPDPDPRVFGLPDPDPDPLVRGMDPDPSIIIQK